MDLLLLESEMDMPAKMVVLPLRCTAVRTTRGTVLISPVDFSAAQLEKIRAFGKVAALVAPNLLHHVHMKSAARHFPEADVWGAPGIDKKVKDIKWDHIFGRDPWPFQNELEALTIEGLPKINETVFLHNASRTLVVTDFCFNLKRPRGWASAVMLRVLGVYKKFAVSKLQLRFLKDRAAMMASVKKIQEWDFDRLVMAHGEVLESGAKPRFDQAVEARLNS
jgi:hypothetical protein